ncbi:MAG: ABC transporter substrate-binding protein [Eubacteriales bacterium]|nr:ABC transporter substrate-binding protein [Eubacteriales bacterium]
MKRKTAIFLTAALALGVMGTGVTCYADEPVELTWYVGGNGPQADLNTVLEEVNAYLTDKLNCTLKIVETDFGSYDQKMQMVIGSGEEFDLCYTANWSNNFYNNVNKNAFLELNDLLDEYAPELVDAVPQAGWDAATVSGNIYAVPNMQIWTMTNCLSIDKEYVDKYNFDVDSVKELKDLEPLLAAIKEDNPDMYPFAADAGGILGMMTQAMGYDELAGRHIPGVVMLDDEELKVVNQFELPQVMDHYKLMYDWSQKGYIRPDASTITSYTADLAAGKHAARVVGNLKPGIEVGESEMYGGKEIVMVQLSDSWLPTSGITATMTAVSRTSKNPEKAVEFLNLFNTDKYLYNLITQGVEGVHYEKLDGDYIAPIENSGYAPNADWMYGNQFLAYLKEGQVEDDWEQTIAMNEAGKTSVAFGFVFDSTTVQNEIASVSAVVQEYQLSLDTGAVDPETVMPEFLNKLEQAGSQVIIDEIQRQLDEWSANK